MGEVLANQTFIVRNTGRGTLSWSETDNMSWLSVTPSSGSLGAEDSQTITLNPDNCRVAGTTSGRIIVSSARETIHITVTRNCRAAPEPEQPNLHVSPTAITFDGVVGEVLANQTFIVRNTGRGTLSWSETDNMSWLSVTPSSGSLGAEDSQTITLNPDNCRVAGTTSGRIIVSSARETIHITVTRNCRAAPEPENVYGNIRCDTSTFNSITIEYSFSNGRNVSLFRGNTRINKWGRSSAFGNITDSGLNENTSYTYYLRNGRFSNSPLIDSVTCTTNFQQIFYRQKLSIRKFVRSIDRNTEWLELVSVSPGELIAFHIEVSSVGVKEVDSVVIRSILPDQIEYVGRLRLDGTPVVGDIEKGLNIGAIPAGGRKAMTFNARVNSKEAFKIGLTSLVSTTFVSGYHTKTVSDMVDVFAVRGVVAEIPTKIITGIINNRFIDFMFLPLTITLIILLLFRKYFLIITGWMEEKRRIITDSNAKKRLNRIRRLTMLNEKLD